MEAPVRPRWGSLQFWPRKRAEKIIPSVNWSTIKTEGLAGFIFYKVGMVSILVKDETANSMTKGKKIVIPGTVLEAPNMKILSVRFYNKGIVSKEVIVSVDKDIKRKLKLPKQAKSLDSEIPKEYDDIRLLVYSLPSQTGVKKTPDLIEIAIGADSREKKLEIAKSFIGKEITLNDFLAKKDILDARALTKGKGLVGPVKRLGLTLKQHKSEKGRRRPGSLGPWHPARVTFRAPMAGQMGLFSRITYNLRLITSGNIKEKDINPGTGFKHYGKIRSSYLILQGSVQGPVKRQVLLTPSFRVTKKQTKKKYEFQEVLQ